MAAAEWLHEKTGKQIAEREKLDKPMRAQEAAEAVISELRVLYAKALPDRELPLMEVVAEAERGVGCFSAVLVLGIAIVGRS